MSANGYSAESAATWIVIPTYWCDDDPTGAFDHPTPLTGASTLPRLLDSLCRQHETDFAILILAGAVRNALLPQAGRAIRAVLEPFAERLKPIVCDGRLSAELRQRYDLPDTAFNLTTYAGVRNWQLLIPHAYGAELIIALDDDEVVAPDYVARARALMSRSAEGQPILGLAGPYADADGNLDLRVCPPTGNIFTDKARIMNAGLQQLVGDPRPVVPSPQVFGGNMLFHRELFTRVGFDPGITRGEDMDYMLNAHLQGIRWWMATDLRITHLPPQQYDAPQYAKLKQDVLRFAYERAKLRAYRVDPAQFDPYPGRFLRDDLEEHALVALQQLATPALVARYGSPEQILEDANRRIIMALSRYTSFATMWPAWMARVNQHAQTADV